MLRHAFAGLALIGFAIACEPSPVVAQTGSSVQMAQPAATTPGRLDRLKARTKESWTQMKRRWSLQREKYASCRKEARQQRLAGRKTQQFLEDCMSR